VTEAIRRVLVGHGIHPRVSRSAAMFAIAGQVPRTRPGRPRWHQYRQSRSLGQSLPHATGATTSPIARPAAEAHPGDHASRETARELDYRLCCMPRTMRISRTPPSTWAVPSATKPCLR
jgi:hypothetical protein